MKNKNYKIIQLSTPQELHEECSQWLSQLAFIKDEQQFLDELIKDYTLPLIAEKVYSSSLSIVGNLAKEEKQIEGLIKRCQDHSNKIEVFFDKKNDPKEEEAYKEEHYYLKMEVFRYIENYKQTKEDLFGKIKAIMKSEGPKYLSKQ